MGVFRYSEKIDEYINELENDREQGLAGHYRELAAEINRERLYSRPNYERIDRRFRTLYWELREKIEGPQRPPPNYITNGEYVIIALLIVLILSVLGTQ